MDAPKTHVKIEEASREVLGGIVDQVMQTALLVADNFDSGPFASAIDRLFKEPEFAEWPLDRRAQPAYVQALTERVLAEMGKPVEQEAGVAEAYLAPSRTEPEVDQASAAAAPTVMEAFDDADAVTALEEEKTLDETDPFHQGRPDVHDP